MKAAPLSHQAIVAALKGKPLRIPDLRGLFSAWPTPSPGPYYPATRSLVTKTIQRIADTAPLVGSRVKDDIGLLTCLWYPRSSQERLRTLAQFSTWLVCWDDCVDANEGELAGDLARADAWRAETLDVAGVALGLKGRRPNTPAAGADADALENLLGVSLTTMSRAMTETQRRGVFRELQHFVMCCGTEQRMQMDRVLTEYEAYMDYRLGTVGGGLLCSLVHYALGQEGGMSPAFDDSEAARRLRKQVCILLALVNDILSLKKELRTSCAMNAVASLMTPDTSLSQVVEEVIQKIVQARDDFDNTASMAVAQETLAGKRPGELEGYIDGCRTVVTGTLEFTLSSPRYGLAKLLRPDGSLEIVL